MFKIKSIVTVVALLTTMTAWAQALTPLTGTCGAGENAEDVKWTLSDEDEDGTYDKLAIEKVGETGEIQDFNNYNNSKGIPDNRPWATYKTDIKEVTVGEGITRIGKHAFRYLTNTELKAIDLPSTLTSIGDSAFIWCYDLPSITLPSNSNLTTVGIRAFYQCKKMKITGDALPQNLRTIGEMAFSECESLLLSAFPAGLTTIGKSAFSACKAFTSFTISNKKHVAQYLFARCSNLTSVSLPEKLTSIPMGMFQNCSSLTSVNIPSTLTTIGASAFYACAFTSFTVPSTVKTIGNYAFEDCKKLKSIEISQGVNTLGYFVFANCTALESVTLPTGITSVGREIFSKCTSLESITLPSDWTSIPNGTFEYCEKLEEIVWPTADVVEIGYDAFIGCKKLTSSNFDIPSTVKKIGSSAFKNCTGLTKVTIPEGVEEISSNMFYGCTGLTSVNLPSTLTSIGSFAFYGCSDAFSTVDIPSGVTTIGQSAFKDCTSITSVHIPSTLKTIDNSLFYGCSNLSELTIDEGVETIETYAFLGCNLTSLVLPSTVKELSYSPFAGNDNLATVTLNGNPKFKNANSFPETSVVTMNIKAKEGENGEYWTTFYNEQVNCLVDENTKIYKTSVFGDFLTLTELTADKIIPKNTPVVLRSNASPVSLTITTTKSKNDVSENSLQGVKDVEGKNADDKTYVLNKKATAGVGFYKLKAGATLGLNKAYLSHESATARDFYSFDDETMEIENMTIIGRNKSPKQEAQAEAINGNVYDLQGRRVAQPAKGLYIVNGKKIVIK